MRFDPLIYTNFAESFLYDYWKNAKKDAVVLGLSGGVDSAVVLNLAANALHSRHIIAVEMPDGLETQIDSVIDANTVAHPRCVFPEQIDIKPIVDLFCKTLSIPEDDHLGRGNIAARVRMTTLYSIAGRKNALVLGTENKTEHYLGYFTKGGDELSDIELIRDLTKTQVFKLAEYLCVPPAIISKPPSANLWLGQTDEDEFGFTYEEADMVIDRLLDGEWPTELIAKGLKSVASIERRMRTTEFKRQEVPYPKLADIFCEA